MVMPFLLAHKGNATVIPSTEDYTYKIMTLLQDQEYKKLAQ